MLFICNKICSNNILCSNCNILHKNINDGCVLCLSLECYLTYNVLSKTYNCIHIDKYNNIAIETLTNYINYNLYNNIIKDIDYTQVMFCYKNFI